MNQLWANIPIIIKAIILGFIMLFPIVLINQTITIYNVNVIAEYPWGFILVLIFLWLYWQLATGKQYPFGASDYRKYLSMTNAPKSSKNTLGIVFISVVLFVFVCAVNSIGFGLFGTENTVQLQFINLIGTAPRVTAILLFLGIALTAGIVEEIVFRGYIQKMIQDKYGVLPSFLFVGIIFTLIHFLPLELLIPYFLVSLAFSWVAFQTQSVIPGIIVHVLFDFLAFTAVYQNLTIISESYMNATIPRNIAISILALLGLWYFRNGNMPLNINDSAQP